jgi:hypothetical protein
MDMTKALFTLAFFLAIAVAGAPAIAGERLNDGLLGAGAGAIVGGPAGAAAGGAIGYVGGPAISHHHYRGRHHHHRYD